MAIFDRMRERMRGQRPVGAAEEMMARDPSTSLRSAQDDTGRGGTRQPMTGGMDEQQLEG